MKIKYEQSAGGVVFKNEKGKILTLIVKHSKEKHWSFPKGHIGDKDKDEDIYTAALREVQEEGGIKAKIIEFVPKTSKYQFKHNDYLIKKTVFYFPMEYVSGDTKNHDSEIEQAEFLNYDEVLKKLTYENDKNIFIAFYKKYKNRKS
ncbi:MAG: hydrolase [Patescibacteria group bacterium]|nr:MAG: hydrolase [Patescibacteria group bacterium]